MHTDDKALIEAFQAGDEFAFISLYNRYKGPVYAYCLKMLLDSEQAQDIMQETFLRIYENRERLLNTSSFKAWTFTIARNQCLNQFRRTNKHVGLDEDHTRAMRETAALKQIADLEKSEQIRLVNYFLGRLKPEYREVIVLREYQNLTYDEIAAITRSTLSAVKSRLFKARRKLAAFMEPVMLREQQRVVASRLEKKAPS
ncbi:MAG: RNA polymerase sigma factor [Rhodothermales bacterium]